tara:strand:+ start:164 stop:667 length:504 start_codon:yes stop_codon:yes gene_type:complete
MGKRTGKQFETEIRRSLREVDCWWFRIQDTMDISRYVKAAIAEKQPGDFFVVYHGRAILLEAKTTRNRTSFPLYYGDQPSILAHQITKGLACCLHGGESYIVIRRDIPRSKRVWIITPTQAERMYKDAKKENRKSVKWSWFKENAYEIKIKSKPIRWDILGFLRRRL